MKKLILLTSVSVLYFIATAQTNVGIVTNSPASKPDVSGALSLREGAALTLGNAGASGGSNDNITLPDICVHITEHKLSFLIYKINMVI